MAIARDQLIVGGKAYLRTRLNAAGGAAVAFKTISVRIRDVNRGAAEIEFKDGKRRTAPFGELEPDHEYLAEYAAKQAQKKARIRAEATVTPLTYKLEERLMQEDKPAHPAASQATRDEAQKAIEELKKPKHNKPPESEEERRAAVELYRSARERNESRDEVAEQLGIHRSTLDYWEQKLQKGLPLVTTRGSGKTHTPRSLRIAAAREYLLGKETQTSVADRYNVSQSQLGVWSRKYRKEALAAPPVSAVVAPPVPQAAPVAEPDPPRAKVQEDTRLLEENAQLREENARLRAKVRALLKTMEDL